MSKSVRTEAQFIGKKDAATAEKIDAIRKAWLKAKPEAQAEIVFDFKVGYISGRDRVSISQAEAIVQAGKGADAINAPAIVRAVAAWHDQVMKGVPKATTASTAHKRISKEARAMAMDFLGNFEGKNRTEQINKAIALLNALK
jgi:hypothetical protein